MTALIPREEAPRLLAEMPTPELRAELARGLTLTAATLTRLGLIWAELERRGEDLSELRQGLARLLPLIAAGRLAAEAVVSFAARPAILRALEGVPLEHQRRLAAGEPIEVVVPDEPRRTERVSVQTIPAARLRTIFADGEVLPPAEQRLRLAASRRRKAPGEGEAPRHFRPRYDRDTGTVTVGRMQVRLADLLTELASAAGPDHPPPDIPEEYVQAKTRLTQEESRRLLAAARKAGLPEWEMIRKALRAFGLI